MKEIFKRIKKSHPDYLIIIKKNNLGQIYESDAIIAKEILDIKLMRKAKYRMNLHEINSKIFSFMSVDKAIDNGL